MKDGTRPALDFQYDSKIYLVSKRIIDVLGATIALIVLFPLLILIAILIKLENSGPVIFVQKRCGKDGKIFNMYKFRSMNEDAEEKFKEIQHLNQIEGLIFKIKNDPRITRVGNFIRKTSIDELPQLVNILKGEMSIVGPRPPLPSEVKRYDLWQYQRLSVKPGLTCLWQISGRSNLGFEDMVMLDLKYIAERNILYDFKIILKTIPVVLKSDGAY